jgi:uncharacterized membrane protein
MLLVLVGLCLNAFLFSVLPDASRRGVYFSVSVSPEFAGGDVAPRFLARYRVTVLIASAGAVLLFLASANPWLQWTAVFGQSALIAAAWARESRSVLPYRAAPESRRSATLALRDETLPGGVVGVVGPFLILAAAALYIFMNHERVPQTFPTRWDLSGDPIRWIARTSISVYGSLIMGACVVALMVTQAAWVVRRTRQIAHTGDAMEAERRFKRGDVLYRVFSAYAAAILFAYFSTRSVAVNQDLGSEALLFLFGIVACSTAMTLWMLQQGQGGTRGLAVAPRDIASDDAWLGGILYFNPSDPVVLVERRMGVGWTLNLGNPRAVMFVGAILLMIIIGMYSV